MKIGIQGGMGSFSEEAAQLFSINHGIEDPKIVYLISSMAVLEAVESDKISYGEIEIARTSEGEKLQFFEQMITLAHEMIHIKQYMKGEMTDEPQAVWHGRNHEKTPYGKQPWELEAHKMEHELFAKCFPWYLEIN